MSDLSDLQRAAAHESFAASIRARLSGAEEAPIQNTAIIAGMPRKVQEAWALGHEVHAQRLRMRCGRAPTAQAPALSSSPQEMARAFAAMKPLERARLKQSNPERYEQLRSARVAEVERLTAEFRSAKTHDAYKAIRSQLIELGVG